MSPRSVLPLVLSLLPLSLAAQPTPPPLFDDLGSHSYAVSTRVPLAQRYFDQGLRLTYAFNHGEAVLAFREAARLDPGCAMCHAGIALALGPNINAPMEAQAEREAFAAVQAAQAQAGTATHPERMLIAALAARYAAEPDPTRRAALDSAYARGLGELVRMHPEDLEAATLYAEALMDLSPWNYWTAGEPRPHTREIVATLERVITRNPQHPGACHFYIHAVEAVAPERAVPCAERLAQLMPGAGHLVHMPAHIYIRVGRYAEAAEHNEHAIHADEAYIEGRRPEGVYPLAYYPHNIHFLWAIQSIQGRSADALRSADLLLERVPLAVVQQVPPFESFRPVRLYTLARFGRWEDVLREPAPPQELRFTRGMWHHVRGVARARSGHLRDAFAELDSLTAIAAATPPEQVIGINSAATLLEIARQLLLGEIAAVEQPGEAVGFLENALRLEDGLTYDEPPPWYAPVRQTLGRVLLAWDQPEEAERVYREELRRFPNNGWSLFGLAQALEAQGRTHEAEQVRTQAHAAWSAADIPPPRFTRER